MATPANQTFNLPPSTAPIIDVSTGAPTPAFYFLLVTIQNRTGGIAGINLDTVNATANAALALGHTNSTAIGALQTQVTSQGITITAIQSTANTALTTSNSAVALVNNLRTLTLQKANNLSDLSNTSTARTNIGLATIGEVFRFSTPTASQVISFPVIRPMSIPINFTGTVTFVQTFATADAVFTVQVIRNGQTFLIGRITLIHAGNFSSFTLQPVFPLIVDDCVQIVAPSIPDATLAGVAINMALNIT